MSMFSTLSNAVQSTFTTITKVANATQEIVTIGTEAIDRKAIHIRESGKNNTAMDIARDSLSIKKELDADVELKALFDESIKLFA